MSEQTFPTTAIEQTNIPYHHYSVDNHSQLPLLSGQPFPITAIEQTNTSITTDWEERIWCRRVITMLNVYIVFYNLYSGEVLVC